MVKTNCVFCGKEFLAKKSHFLKGWGRFCSHSCSLRHKRKDKSFEGENNPNWKGGRSKIHYEYKKKQIQRHPHKIRAREKVRYAVKTGKLLRMPCEICGEEKVQAHHDDYSKPLEVRWLCAVHHREVHNLKTGIK